MQMTAGSKFPKFTNNRIDIRIQSSLHVVQDGASCRAHELSFSSCPAGGRKTE